MQKLTKPTRNEDITRTWYLVDAGGKIIGRIASEIALLLMGKSKTLFAKNIDCGDYVVVTNAKTVVSTGKKETTKMYGNFSGYPGGLKEKALWQIREEKPEEIIRHAVMGMLPKNKLRDRMITRLFVYADDKHPYQEKIGTTEK
jgi:large subunit ribosomal protein L13